MIGRKEIYKWIREQAKLLPEEGYVALHKVMEKHGDTGVRPEMHKVNHIRRLKRIWNRTQSLEAINNYFLKFNMQLNYTP